ncbi:MFS transporter [Amycolatopsis jiangsuensis]|uniref:MFS family permease n=1 Tax=Amycolatopsis jiangsuensis TaxID=1181879 RepID=A0A840IZG2_9PSEU|nr:MFS transporter [Amycolatopsis jiangsuensis]MBB4686805.1 MFS family permease [Amycolatopsis jiangsuensis]
MASRPGAVLVASGGGTLLALAVFTAPLSIVPAVAGGLGGGAVATSWILSSMSLGLAVALLPAGAIGDDFGRRRVFVAGAVVTAAGSLLCALAPEPLLFIGGRVVEGFGAAALIACGLAVLGPAFPDAAGRARATGTWGACLGAGIAIGPMAGAAFGSWRALYLVLTAVALGVAVLSHRLVDESVSGRTRTVDLPGALLLGCGLAALLAALTEGRQGWTSPFELTLLAAAVVLLAGFFGHQNRAGGGVLDLALFRRPALIAATLGAFVAGAGVTALMSFVCTMLENGLALHPLAAAWVVLGWSATSVVSALLTRRLPSAFSGGARLSGGLLVVAVGLVPLAFVTPGFGFSLLLPGMIVAGFGTGVVNASLGGEAVGSVPPHRTGMGSGINNTSRYVGAALGVTVVTLLSVRPPGTPASLTAGWNTAVVVAIAVSLAGAGVIAALTVLGKRWTPDQSPHRDESAASSIRVRRGGVPRSRSSSPPTE